MSDLNIPMASLRKIYRKKVAQSGVGLAAAAKKPSTAAEPSATGVRLVALGEIPFTAVLDHDRRCFSVGRENFLREWIAQPGTYALGAVAGERLLGYGVLRPCRNGFKIGPLFADSPGIAEAIFSGLRQALPAGEPFYLDVMATAPHALDLVTRHGMQVVFETARMYFGPAPDLVPESTYGITSFELG